MKAKKKNRFLTFCCSLLPGAAEMYMGFMKMGVSLMLLFLLGCIIPMVLRLDGLISFAFIIWFYGFFHANHLASLEDETFSQVEDTYLFEMEQLVGGHTLVQKYYNWIAGGLIAVGILLLWNAATDVMYTHFPVVYEIMWIIGNYLPKVLVAVLIIVIGVRMILGKKKQLAQGEEQMMPVEDGAEKKEE